MLLDIGSVLGGIGLAVVGFVVVIVVCVVILRLLAAILPSYEDRTAPEDPTVVMPDANQTDVAGEVGHAAAADATKPGEVTAALTDDPEPAPEEGEQLA